MPVEVCPRCRFVHEAGCCARHPSLFLDPEAEERIKVEILNDALLGSFREELVNVTAQLLVHQGLSHEAAALEAAARVSELEHRVRDSHETQH